MLFFLEKWQRKRRDFQASHTNLEKQRTALNFTEFTHLEQVHELNFFIWQQIFLKFAENKENQATKVIKEGPVPWCKNDQLTFVAEQVSHHPPSKIKKDKLISLITVGSLSKWAHYFDVKIWNTHFALVLGKIFNLFS